MQVDLIKPVLKASGTVRLKLKCDVLITNFAFKFNLRRYTLAHLTLRDRDAFFASETLRWVRRCRLTYQTHVDRACY